MPLSLRKEDITIHPRGLVYLLLFVVLLALTRAAIGGDMKMVIITVSFPLATFILLVGAQYPMASFLVYSILVCYFQCICRYFYFENISIVLLIFLLICAMSIVMNKASKRVTFVMDWRNAFNVWSIGNVVWELFTLFEYLAPSVQTPLGPALVLNIYLAGFISAFLLGLLLDTPKKLRWMLILLCIYVFTAACKLFWQKKFGFDHAEIQYLLEVGAWRTHLLADGTKRYFSFFSDAGNFGNSMGFLLAAFLVPAFVLKRVWLRWCCLGTVILAGIGLFMSGTRGGMVIPFVGIAMFVLLSKNMTAIVTSTVTGALCFSFFYFTNIGDDNKFIHRARTAFRPDEDASFNVRVENQKRFAFYLKDKPFGLGKGGAVYDTKDVAEAESGKIPTDSALVDIWVEHGAVGLCVYLIYMGVVILRCCYVLLFKVRNSQLRMTLAGLLGAVCGLLVAAYVGRTWGMAPSSFLVPLFISFVLNGPYIDKQMQPDENL